MPILTGFGWQANGSYRCLCGERFNPNLRGERPVGLVSIHHRTCLARSLDSLSDQDLRDRLKTIDESTDVDVTGWEGEFLDNVVYKQQGRLTTKQRETALKILEQYEG